MEILNISNKIKLSIGLGVYYFLGALRDALSSNGWKKISADT